MRVLVCGGRNYRDRATIFAALDALDFTYPITLIIHGSATGADSLAGKWAEQREKAVLDFPADWEHGDPHYEGRRRNGRMLHEGKPTCVVAFPGGSGTAHMVGLARAARILVWEPTEERDVP